MCKDVDPRLFLLGCHFGFSFWPVLFRLGPEAGELEYFIPLLVLVRSVLMLFMLHICWLVTHAVSVRIMSEQRRLFVFYAAGIPYATCLIFPKFLENFLSILLESMGVCFTFVAEPVFYWFLSVFVVFTVSFFFKGNILQKINGMFAKITRFVFWAGLLFFLLPFGGVFASGYLCRCEPLR